jgi:hypothetical protein
MTQERQDTRAALIAERLSRFKDPCVPDECQRVAHEIIALTASDAREPVCQEHGDPLVCIACEQEDDAQPVWQNVSKLPRCRKHNLLKLSVAHYYCQACASADAREPQPAEPAASALSRYCATCYHALDRCSHCDTQPAEPSRIREALEQIIGICQHRGRNSDYNRTQHIETIARAALATTEQEPGA